MTERINVHVKASDPISEAGVKAALRNRAEVWVEDDVRVSSETISVVVSQGIDDEALRLLRHARGQGMTQSVVVVTELDDAALMLAVEAGVRGLLRRSEATSDRLVQAITTVSRGSGMVPPDLLGRLLKQVSQVQSQVLTPRGLRFNGLTERESEILKLVASGHDTREIAERLSYSERTVKNVLHDVTSRFNLRNRSHAVAYAIQEGFI
ncbi:helix-turn-helix transcriptional regulator [Streptomyces chartreusis]|uniref:helix-turn-helix transcriptional regulator n=1 Tax=Streptomyces chartreusis TaxID=1969 RepID=UPI0033E5EC0E